MNTHDNEYLSKLREHERYLDRLQEMHEPLVNEDQIDYDDKELTP